MLPTPHSIYKTQCNCSSTHFHSFNMSRTSAFSLIVLCFLLCSAFCSVEGCPPHELKALLRFRSSLHDTAGMLKSWKGDDCCKWKGIKCNETQEGRHVSKLDLADFDLRSIKGAIDSSLFELTHLNYMDLSGNYFHGEIPSQLGKLFSLRHLYLDSDTSSCAFDYHLSCNIHDLLTSSSLHWLSSMSSLEYLTLRVLDVRDKKWGNIVGSLLHLKHLDMWGSSLSAPTIPSTLLNLSSLTFLDLSYNSLSNIPTWMGKLSSLTHLGLSSNNLPGSILNIIGNLSLTHLDLSYNNISGSIVNAIENLSLTGIEYLDLSFNSLTGQIPLSLGYNSKQYGSLSLLNLGGNKLEGTIPSGLGFLMNLTYLSLESNQLRGNIPASFGNLYKLKVLYLYKNKLNGSLPLSFAHLSSLTDLDVRDNQLNGSIPSALMLLSSLQYLFLSNNNMNGTITEVFFQKYLKLEYLDLSHTGLSINISSTWIPSFQLRLLYLRNCQIGGPIPSWISTQFSLRYLDLSANELMGDLPSWLWDIDEVRLSDNHLQGSFTPTSGSLRYLDLSKNELSGRLQADVHLHLPNAEVLMLADNKFEGQIPTSIAKLRNLTFLDMSNNHLMGNVPANVGNLTHLQALNLDYNFLEGEIPKELCSLSYLQSLCIGNNNLQGVLPSSLTNLSRLEVLDVGANSLTGNIPHWIANFSSLRFLQMRHSNFRGNLPPEIGQMPKLQVLDLSYNSFSGVIPDSYFRLQAMQNSSAAELLWISSKNFGYYEGIDLIVKGQERHYERVLSSMISFDLSNNRLSGPLPPEIENLKGLMFLNLSRNSLSGQIPQSLGNLVHLESLDLSFNKFSGQIPQLGRLNYLAHLSLSHNNLSGRIPREGAQMLTFEASSYIGNPDLWGCPLARNCSRPVAQASPPLAVGVEERTKDFKFPWYWMCFGLSWGVGFSVVVLLLVLKVSCRTECFAAMDKVIEMMDRGICMLPKLKPRRVWG